MSKTVETMITAFRDGFQSAYGARVRTRDFLPAVEASVEAGIRHFEAGGGARFQSLFFYCQENAFDMMDAFRAAAPDANLQTLSRGVNVVGLDSQSSDIVRLHAQMFKKHGMTTIRNFDALNDVTNLIFSGQCIHEAGLNHEVVVSMMALPPGCEGAHDADFYEKNLREILDADIPYSSVCFKDASGTATPATVHESIRRARVMLPEGTRISFHTHDTAGTGILCYKAAIEAGADQIDLSMAPVSGGTCQPDVISMWHALRGSGYELDVDIDKMVVASDVLRDCMKDYFMPPEAKEVEPMIPFCPMPGGALTANTQMLRDNGIMEKYPEIIRAMGEVVRKGGFGTSVTPVSQFYFQQAFNNVMMGPWNKIADGYGKMVLGYFGRTPTAPDPEVIRIASEQMKLEPTTRPVLELNDADPTKGIEVAKKMLRDAGITDLSDENIFIAATCKEKGIDFLLGKATSGVRMKQPEMDDAPVAKSSGPKRVTVNGRSFLVELSEGKAVVNGNSYKVSVSDGPGDTAMTGGDSGGGGEVINSQTPGKVFKLLVSEGDQVQKGQVMLILEAMKMEVEVQAPRDAQVTDIRVEPGGQVKSGQALLTLL